MSDLVGTLEQTTHATLDIIKCIILLFEPCRLIASCSVAQGF